MLRKIALLCLLVLVPFFLFILVNQLLYVSRATIKTENEQIKTLMQNNENLVCILRANKRKHYIGEQPDIQVEIMNKTDSAVLMVRCLDGSDFGFRLPISRFTINSQVTGKVESTFYGCLSFNPLKESDFQEVESGKSFDPYGGSSFCSIVGFSNFMMPGIYQLTYNYSTVGSEVLNQRNKESIQNGLSLRQLDLEEGKEEGYFHENRKLANLDSLWECLPKVELQSNTITIEYNLFTIL